MQRRTRTRLAAAAATAALLGTLIGPGRTPVQATVPAPRTPTTISTDAGHLALEISGSRVTVARFDAENRRVSADVTTYSLDGRCTIAVAPPATERRFLGFSTSAGVVGLDSNGIGSKLTSRNNCTRADGRIEAGESLTVQLDALLLPGLRIDAVELDLEGKFAAVYALSTDGTLTQPATQLSRRSDGGNDSGAGDNNLVRFGSEATNADDFTRLTITAVDGEIALNGGGDGIYPEANRNSKGTFSSIFHLVSTETFEYTVGCGQEVQADNVLDGVDSTNELGVADSLVQSVRYIRFPNKGQTACPAAADDKKIGVEIQASQYDNLTKLDDVFVNNSSTSADGTPQDVRARLEIVWVVETSGKTSAQVEIELAREIDVVPGDATPGVPVVYCTSVPSAVAAAPLDPTVTAEIAHPADTPWCLIHDERTVVGSTIVQTQIYSGNGDPQFK